MQKITIFLFILFNFLIASVSANNISESIIPDNIKSSSENKLSQTNNLFDNDKTTSFSFDEKDTKAWIEYNYDYSNINNVYIDYTFRQGQALTFKIDVFRNNSLLNTYTSNTYISYWTQPNYGNLNFIIPDKMISDKIVITAYDAKSANQNIFSKDFKYLDLHIVWNNIEMDYDKELIDKLMDNFFIKTDKLWTTKSLEKYKLIQWIIKKMNDKTNTYYLLEYMLFKIEDKIFEVEKKIKYDKIQDMLK